MNTLQDFFDNAKSRNLCERGAKIWEHCKSKKSLIDFALGSWGCDFLCTAIRDNWSVDPQEIKREFENFNCGRYTRDKDGYTSKMYCLPETDEITIDTTLTLIIGFNGVVHVPENRVCELYIVKSDVRLEAECNAIVQSYDSKIKIAGNGNVNVKIH